MFKGQTWGVCRFATPLAVSHSRIQAYLFTSAEDMSIVNALLCSAQLNWDCQQTRSSLHDAAEPTRTRRVGAPATSPRHPVTGLCGRSTCMAPHPIAANRRDRNPFLYEKTLIVNGSALRRKCTEVALPQRQPAGPGVGSGRVGSGRVGRGSALSSTDVLPQAPVCCRTLPAAAL
jgi:hypothetical protein